MSASGTWRAALWMSCTFAVACGGDVAPESSAGQPSTPIANGEEASGGLGGSEASSGTTARGGAAQSGSTSQGGRTRQGGTSPTSANGATAQPSSEFPTAMQGPGAELPAICHELADAVCARKAECGALRNDYGQEYGECRWRMLTSCASNWNQPEANFGEEGLTQCLADLDAYDCFALLHLYGIGVPTSVQDCSPPGERHDGEPCESRFQCVGEVCTLDETTGCQQCLTLNDGNADAWALSGVDYGHVENAGDPPSHGDCTNEWLRLIDGVCQPAGDLDVSPRNEPEPEPEPVADRSLAGQTCFFESDCGMRATCSGAVANELTGMQTQGVCTLTLSLGEECTDDAMHVSCESYADCIDGICQLPIITVRDYEPLPESCEPTQ